MALLQQNQIKTRSRWENVKLVLFREEVVEVWEVQAEGRTRSSQGDRRESSGFLQIHVKVCVCVCVWNKTRQPSVSFTLNTIYSSSRLCRYPVQSKADRISESKGSKIIIFARFISFVQRKSQRLENRHHRENKASTTFEQKRLNSDISASLDSSVFSLCLASNHEMRQNNTDIIITGGAISIWTRAV